MLTASRGESALLMRSYGTLADISRHRDRFDDMQTYRERQAALAQGPLGWQVFEAARDRRGSDGAAALYRQARQLAAASGDLVTAYRADLEICQLQASCNPDSVRAAHEADVPVIPVPGPSAVTAALSVAGFPADRFLFAGFLPSKTAARRRALRDLATTTETLVVFEAPHRILASLALDRNDEWANCGLVRERAERFPPEPLRFVGALAVRKALASKERAEDRGRKPGTVATRLAALAPAGFVPTTGKRARSS